MKKPQHEYVFHVLGLDSYLDFIVVLAFHVVAYRIRVKDLAFASTLFRPPYLIYLKCEHINISIRRSEQLYIVV